VAAVLTVQDGVSFGWAGPRDAEGIAAAVRVLLAALPVGAVKTGALGGGDAVRFLAEALAADPEVPLVVDPVLRSTTGGALVDEDGARAVRELLMPRAALTTPNLAEAAVLAGFPVDDIDGMVRAAREIGRLGARSVLVKGGHLPGERVVDVLWTSSGEVSFEEERLPSGEVRGTGCALAAAAAAGLARGEPVELAVTRARALVREAIGRSARVGAGPRVLVFE
jgi:hydroxymethylpyrimidine/phosphomethylpyrimidine kinase